MYVNIQVSACNVYTTMKKRKSYLPGIPGSQYLPIIPRCQDEGHLGLLLEIACVYLLIALTNKMHITSKEAIVSIELVVTQTRVIHQKHTSRAQSHKFQKNMSVVILTRYPQGLQ